jgi:acetyltransferase-like isoleucine patch superfamily enzyme/acyl carrier protein
MLMVMNKSQEAVPPDNEAGEEYAFPATVGQWGFWYLDQLQPGNPAHNIALRFTLTGPLRADLLEQALTEVVCRHESLRTAFASDGDNLLQVVSPPRPVPLPVDELRGDSDPRGRAEELMAAEACRGFDLETGPLFRARMLRLDDREHVLLLTFHQTIADGWSTGIVLRELAALYGAFESGQPSPLPEPTIQYGDYAVWQSEWLRTPAVAPQIEYWKRRLDGLEPVQIPRDESARTSQTSSGQIESILLPRELTDQLTRISHGRGATLFVACLACLKLLLRLRTSRDDISVSTLTAGRSRTELESVVGRFANTLVFRTDLSGDPTLLELLERVHATVTDGMANQDVPFGCVVDALPAQRQTSRASKFRLNFIFQRAFLNPQRAGEVSFTPIRALSPGAMLDLNFFMVEREEGWRASCEYSTGDYLPETIRGLLQQFQSLLTELARDPKRKISTLQSHAEDAPRPVPDAVHLQNGKAPAVTSATVDPDVSAQVVAAPAPDMQAVPEVATDTAPYVAPRNEVESKLAAIWADVLKVRRVSVTADFFEMGGHSLSAARLLVMIQSAFGVRLTPGKVFEEATVEKMAVVVAGAAGPVTSLASLPVEDRDAVAEWLMPSADEPVNQITERPDSNSDKSLYQFLAVSNHPLAKAARQAKRFGRRFSIPAPRVIFRPILLLYLWVRAVYFFFLRVFVCEPLFKAYCQKYGRNVHTGTYLHWVKGRGSIVLGDNITIDGKCSILFGARFVKSPSLTIGSMTGISHKCMFVIGKSITIGSHCAIASGTIIFDSSGHPNDAQRRIRGESTGPDDVKPVVIRDHVWIGRNAIIVPGVTIGEGAIVATGSVVMTDVAPYTVVSGNPAGKVGDCRPARPDRITNGRQ